MADGEQQAQDAQILLEWAAAKKISKSAMDSVIELGFSSMEAIECLSAADLSKGNVSVGQRKLILKAVSGLGSPSAAHTPDNADAEANPAVAPNPGGSQNNDSTNNVNPGGSQNNGSTNNPGSIPQSGEDDFQRKLLESLQQSIPGAGLQAAGQPIGVGAGSNPQVAPPPLQGMLSWQDPQVYLKSVINSKPSCYNIVDFIDVTNSVSEKVLSAGDDGMEIVCRSGSRKPKLEGITISQWSLANIAILYKLFQEGTLKLEEVFDYLSYTSHIYSLIGSHEVTSVYFYDREYRRLQADHKFRWGTAIGHLAPSFLRLRAAATNMGGAKPRVGPRPDVYRPPQRAHSSFQAQSAEGRHICRNYNSINGCVFKGCKYDHVCNVPGCGRGHPSCSHGGSSKN